MTITGGFGGGVSETGGTEGQSWRFVTGEAQAAALNASNRTGERRGHHLVQLVEPADELIAVSCTKAVRLMCKRFTLIKMRFI